MSRVHRGATPLMLAASLSFAAPAWADGWLDLWLTPDQQGARLEARGDPAGAAERYRDPMRRGVAQYRAGDFESAAASFGQVGTAEALFDRGNALILLGQYDDAIASYDQALAERPGWPEALDNRALARARKARLAPPDDDAGGTGGMLEADDIVFDETGKRGGGEQVVEEPGAGSAAEDRAMWLRRVQTRPADFLRARFAVQLERQQAAGASPP